MKIKQFKKLPIMGIMRGLERKTIKPLTETIVSSGLKTVEIAMNTKNAPKLIRSMARWAKERFTIGAGTVTTMDRLKKALDAGATFIVLPTLIPDVVEYCAKRKIAVFPGALTPQEIYNAWNAGATMVKVFPAKFFGPSYIKEIKGPFKDIELLVCGGVNPDNIKAFFENGASGVAFGGSIFKKGWIERGKFSRVEKSIKSLITSYRYYKVRNKK